MALLASPLETSHRYKEAPKQAYIDFRITMHALIVQWKKVANSSVAKRRRFDSC